MQGEDFAHLGADGHVRRQAGQRILEDHRHLGAADAPEFGFRGLQRVGAIEQDFACRATIAGQKPHRGECGLALAGAAFADDAEAFPGCHMEGDAAHRIHGAVGRVEINREVFNSQDRHDA